MTASSRIAVWLEDTECSLNTSFQCLFMEGRISSCIGIGNMKCPHCKRCPHRQHLDFREVAVPGLFSKSTEYFTGLINCDCVWLLLENPQNAAHIKNTERKLDLERDLNPGMFLSSRGKFWESNRSLHGERLQAGVWCCGLCPDPEILIQWDGAVILLL